ncbi:MAG: hypothetical protein GY881_09645 [Gammaproteobacteria bacterium]|nr:hypothetical protein [Gammaproteobacteria bacterium]
MNIETVKIQQDSGYLVNGNMFVPEAEGNRHYQMILDWINDGNTPIGPDIIEPDYVALRTGPEGYAPTGEQLGMIADGIQAAHVAEVKAKFPKSITGGVTIGEVPQELLDAAADKLFAQQLAAYKAAIHRLEQYIVADGRPELTEMQAMGEQVFNEETGEMEDVLHEVVVQTAIEPVEPTVEQTVYSDDIDAEPTVETVTNPLIVTDEAERASAQAVVDGTPDAVKEA